jgi:hypothetical protein
MAENETEKYDWSSMIQTDDNQSYFSVFGFIFGHLLLPNYFYITFQIEEDNKSISILSTSTDKNRQICWHLPKKFEPSIELLENQIFRFMNVVCILFLSIH